MGSEPPITALRPDAFHPAVRAWFETHHEGPTEAQRLGWPAIQSGRHTLIAAPTGSGKTLAAFLCAIDALVRRAQAAPLPPETTVVYVSPLKALSNDIAKNLERPLAGIQRELSARGLSPCNIETLVRSGDTPAKERQRLAKTPPHILVTTPESLYILLTSESGRRALSTVTTVIVDEIHAMVGAKRGAHLSLSLERLAALAKRPVQRIGLSATQKPLDEVGRFLIGAGELEAQRPCQLVDCGRTRELTLAIELPRSPLEAVMSAEVWGEVYDRLTELVRQRSTTLVFVGNRRLAERLCRQLAERLGAERVAAHHGSLSKERRLQAELRLKNGELDALVATASLELGIDIGSVDRVCQIGSPRTISSLLQRVGRSGHHVGGVPDGRLFPLSRNDLVECCALLDCVARTELDRVRCPDAPLDILAQQLVAIVASEAWPAPELLRLVRRSYCYRDLPEERFRAVLRMLSEGFDTKRGRRAALVRTDPVTDVVSGRRAARLTAVTSGGAIADNTDYKVVLEPEETHVGSIGEDFAVEAMAGDIFQLGNASWQILKVETGVVRVADARGKPPTIPFWLGEGPARSDEVSRSVMLLTGECLGFLESAGSEAAGEPVEAGARGLSAALAQARGLEPAAADQIADYLAGAYLSLSGLPTRDRIVVERFFDEAQNLHLVIHSRYGARINRAWGLALRKRFCKTFNFELQAAATEDAVLLSMGPTHSFELSQVGAFLRQHSARSVLVQALLDAPMFEIRWRHNTARALATPRFLAGKKVPAYLLRIRADDLLATAFPDQQACLENLAGEREIPDHPLVSQTIEDCLTEAMDVAGFLELLGRIEAGQVKMLYRDVTEPSPLAHEILNANPYSFLDPAPLEERRTQAVMTRRFVDPKTASDLGALDRDAIARVRREAWPETESADELSDALGLCGFWSEHEGRQARAGGAFDELRAQGRATRLRRGDSALWVAAEHLTAVRQLVGEALVEPALHLPEALGRPAAEPAVALARLRLQCLGPVAATELAAPLVGLAGDPAAVARALASALITLEAEGAILRGRFDPGVEEEQWCERGLLARIHRYTLRRLRREIEPVDAACFMRFLLCWHHLDQEHGVRGQQALVAVVDQLEGFGAAASAWEPALLSSRLPGYQPRWLDELCLSGRVCWGRHTGPSAARALRSLSTTPITLLARANLSWLSQTRRPLERSALSSRAALVLAALEHGGPAFFGDLQRQVPLRSELEAALSELVAAGWASADGFSGMRGLLASPRGDRHPKRAGRLRSPLAPSGLEAAGRWSALPPGKSSAEPPEECVVGWARLLLRRYGVVFRALLDREAAPPWRDLLRELRAMEARGDVRGGRFVSRMAGEQFALPEAISVLRSQRRRASTDQHVWVAACDPLNLVGALLPGERVPAAPNNALLFRAGSPIAALEAGQVRVLDPESASSEGAYRARLLQGPAPRAAAG